MTPSELLERVAATLKGEVGPAVGEEYPRTQAYFSAVVLQKLGAQMRLAEEHTAADARERDALEQDLRRMLEGAPLPPSLETAFAALSAGGDAALCQFIAALYASRDALGETSFDALLGRVRKTLRYALDRRMEYAS